MIGLLSIVVAFLVALHVQWSPASFGLYHDDSLYLSSARALATGEGYVIPSIPGEPAQTKYPIFYPWLLSLLWRVWPTFPDNLYGAFWLSALAACAFLLGSFTLLRQLGAGEKTALALTAVVAFHPSTLWWSISEAVAVGNRSCRGVSTPNRNVPFRSSIEVSPCFACS